MSVRERRLNNEWKLLEQLASLNPGLVEVVRRETRPDADLFHIVLHRTSALGMGQPPPLLELASHSVAFRFPSFYPGVPIEAFLAVPVFHPNVHLENGFVCLWDRFSSGDTVVEATRKLQRVITWELWNASAEHVMQPEALRNTPAPLACEAVKLPPARFAPPRPGRRVRLS